MGRADEGRDRRAAQRGQVDPLQRADQGRARRPATTRSRRSSRTWRSPRCPTSGSSRSARRCGSSELVPATIYFHDIAGLVKGASEGEGLGNQFLASIRETDAICHVVRCHADSGVPHPDGRVDPLADIETIETELLARRLRAGRAPAASGSTKGAKSGDTEAIAERDWLRAGGRGARRRQAGPLGPGPRRRRRRRRANLQALTSKPILYVANVDEGDAEAPPEVVAPRRGESAPGWSRSAPGSRASWPSSTRPRRRRCASPTGSRAPAWPASSAPPTTCST